MGQISETAARLAQFSGDPRFERSCHSKIRYATEPDAAKQAKMMHKRYKKPFHYYPCSYCEGFHVGTQRSKQAGIRRHARQTP